MDRQMILLLVVMIISLLYASIRETTQNRKICVISITVIIACFSGFRSWWMGDLIKYYTDYFNCNGYNWKEYIFGDYTNIGLKLLFHVAGSIGISYDICLFIISAFFAIALGLLVYKYSPSPYWSYVMFIAMGFYIFTFTGLKQTCAMGFVIFATMAVLENNFRRFLMLVFVAGLFHAPAFVFILAYPAAKKKVDMTYVFIIFATIVLVYLFRDRIIEFLAEAYYDDEKLYVTSGGIGGRMLMMIFIMIFGIIMRPLRNSDIIYRQIFSFMIIAAIIQFFSMYDNAFSRLADYYYQFIVLFMPLIMENGNHQALAQPERKYSIRYFTQNSYFLIGLVITLFALWYYNSYINSSQAILQDFKFFWEIDPYSLYGQ